MTRPSHAWFLALVFVSAATLIPPAASTSEPAETILSTLQPGHPRLLLLEKRIAWLRDHVGQDELLARLVGRLRRDADAISTAPPLERKVDGGRLLAVSRECLRRSLVLGLVWRLDRDPRVLSALRSNLLAVAGFDDWHPEHFLDVAEMCAGMSIGYDWAYDDLAMDDRMMVRSAIMRLGIEPGVAAEREAAAGVAKKTNWWCRNTNNWNLVCHGGLTMAALAVADTDPVPAGYLISCARAEAPLALASFEPDGMWPEGLNYWGYATRYTVLLMASLESSLGDGGLWKDRPGLAKTGDMYVDQRSPTGLLPGFADVRCPFEFTGNPVLSWLGSVFDRPRLISIQRAMLMRQEGAGAAPLDPLDIVWYQPEPRADDTPAPLDRHWRGQVEVASFRSGRDADALSVYVKAGDNRSGHAHLDIGSFEFDLLGQHWGTDLGSDRYDLSGYFSADRWKYFRLNSHSHNVLLINDRNQGVDGTGTVVRFSPGEDPRAVVDCSSAYAADAMTVMRGISLVHGRTVLLVQDEVSTKDGVPVQWGMTVEADILSTGDQAVLTKNGVSISARILSPAGAVFTVASAEQEAPQGRNNGIKRLLVSVQGSQAGTTIAIQFSAVGSDAVSIRPLSEW